MAVRKKARKSARRRPVQSKRRTVRRKVKVARRKLAVLLADLKNKN